MSENQVLQTAKIAYSLYYNRGLPLNPRCKYNSDELMDLARSYEDYFNLRDKLDKRFLELAIKDGFTYETEQEFEEGD